MKNILPTLIVTALLIPTIASPLTVQAALTFCVPPAYPSSAIENQRYIECQKNLQSIKEEQATIPKATTTTTITTTQTPDDQSIQNHKLIQAQNDALIAQLNALIAQLNLLIAQYRELIAERQK